MSITSIVGGCGCAATLLTAAACTANQDGVGAPSSHPAAATRPNVVAATTSHGTEQRISITTAKGDRRGAAWALVPLTPGPLTRDSGTSSACCWTDRHFTRDGEAMSIDDPLKTFRGHRGTFTLRLVITLIEAGHGYAVGTGTWRVTSGTGAYRHLEGNGRIAVDWPDNSAWLSSQSQGLVDLNR